MNKCLFVSLTFACLFSADHGARAVEVTEEIFEQSYALGPNPTLSIRDVDGLIRIYAGSGTDLKLQAIKKAFSHERLKALVIDVKADDQHVSIDTKFPERAKWGTGDRSGTVEYTLTVPATTNITNIELETGEVLIEGLQGGSAKAHLVNGWLAAHDCFGNLDLSVVNGRLDISYLWWANKEFSVNVTSQNGNVRALLPPDASADITAETGTGQIADNFSSEEHGGIVRSLTKSIGTESGCQLNLRARNGNIRIDKSY
ncbi:MAG: hypothetical protein ACR2MF_00185 [Chthoniobacterales bacterium]